ncbi:MAG: hypothetical protein CR968_05015 [Flavobacteriia bacterium]|nr:MAG: hypothetical protein CR968_05015 [Flavobacteriia bacterium]
MKKIILLLVLVMSTTIAGAQVGEKSFIYSTTEFNLGNYLGLSFGLNYIHNNKYSFKLGYSGNLRKPKSQPEDFVPSVPGTVLLQGLLHPYDLLQNYHISAGKIYNLNEEGTIRLNASVGLGYTIIKEPENWVKKGGGPLADNYDWNYSRHNTVSLVVSPRIEVPFFHVYGLTISPTVQVSPKRVYFGIGVGNMVGILRTAKTHQ